MDTFWCTCVYVLISIEEQMTWGFGLLDPPCSLAPESLSTPLARIFTVRQQRYNLPSVLLQATAIGRISPMDSAGHEVFTDLQ